ncbi:hypothetical protein E4U60_000274 [Claviceps pazoutovae]|uniref:Uncharacterized protein n=1 Tax=Claviceps pazoutovae TaxID=1649127 RepID=A0A9P7SBH6_9HYPO|nr:hypothetical protein E4U60_000274 [Claviceps pazoutovae]
MATVDPNISTLEACSEKGTNTTVVARTGFSGNSRKSKPGGKKGVKTTVFSKKPVLATTVVFVPFSEPASSVDIFGSAVVIVRMRLRSPSGEESRRSPDQRSHRTPTEHQGRRCALPPTLSSRETAGVCKSEVSEGTSECGESDSGSTKEAPSVASSGEGVSIRSQGLSDSTVKEYKVIEDNMETNDTAFVLLRWIMVVTALRR